MRALGFKARVFGNNQPTTKQFSQPTNQATRQEQKKQEQHSKQKRHAKAKKTARASKREKAKAKATRLGFRALGFKAGVYRALGFKARF